MSAIITIKPNTKIREIEENGFIDIKTKTKLDWFNKMVKDKNITVMPYGSKECYNAIVDKSLL
jgi:predicted RNA binding protein YcfA (HicA-like mRNA interferase family)